MAGIQRACWVGWVGGSCYIQHLEEDEDEEEQDERGGNLNLVYVNVNGVWWKHVAAPPSSFTPDSLKPNLLDHHLWTHINLLTRS